MTEEKLRQANDLWHRAYALKSELQSTLERKDAIKIERDSCPELFDKVREMLRVELERKIGEVEKQLAAL